MPEGTAKRLVLKFLEAYSHLGTFEIDLYDPALTKYVVEELSRKGCKVEQVPFKSILRVHCPDSAADLRMGELESV